MGNCNLNSKLLTDIQKNDDVTGKSNNVPLSTGFNQQKCHCQHSINVTSEIGTSEVQLVISPTRPSRRGLSNASNDGDFEDVSYKKSKQINNQSGSTIRPQLLHHHNGDDTVNDNVKMNLNVNNHVTTTSSVISNNFPTGHNQQQPLLTTASARYALTRFPFPPHIVRFKSTNVSITHFKAEVIKHYKSNYNLNIEIINCRKIDNKLVYVNYICYEIEEYIAPVNVLVCSKCCSIGHFRRQCTEQDETCKSCGQSFKDLKMHHCSSIIKCKHCNGDHLSNSMKCPVVKTFRADLTKKLMNINNNVTSYSWSITANIANNNKSQHIHNDFPRTAAPWAPSSNPMDLKLNTLISGLSQVNETLSKLCVTNQDFQQFMIEKNENDIRINNEIDDLKSNNNKMDQDIMVLNQKVNDLDKLMKSNDGIFKQFLFPMLDDILKFIDTKNVGRGGKTVDPDLK
ncbi:unnamed protein product, partial [Adineta steineri]